MLDLNKTTLARNGKYEVRRYRKMQFCSYFYTVM